MKPILALLFILCSFCSLSQQKKIDSLLAVNNNYGKEDSQKVIHLVNIFRQYGRLGDFRRVEEYGAKALQVAQKLPQTISLSHVYLRLALCYHATEQYVKAIEYYNKGIEVAQKRNDRNAEAGIYLNLSALFGSIPDYAKSLEASQLAVGLYNALGDQEQISSCYMNIGAIYLDIKDPVKGVAYIKKALTIFKTQGKDGLNYGTAIAYQSIGNAYQLATDNELQQLNVSPFEKNAQSIQNYNEALKVAAALEEADELKAAINNDIGMLYEKMGNRVLALQHFTTALQFVKVLDNKQGLADILYSTGNFYLNEKDYEKSKTYLDQSLQIGNDNDFLSIQQNSLEKLSVLYEQTGRFDSAIAYYKRYIAVKNTITDKEKEKDIARKQLQIDFAVKENDYKLAQELTGSKLKQQVLLAKQQQQQLELRQQQLQLINKEKDLERLAYLKKQSELQNEQQLQAALMQRNAIQFKYDKESRDKKIATQETQISFDKKVKTLLTLGALLAVIIGGLIFYNQRKTKKLNTIINEQKASLQQLSNEKDKIFSVVSHDMRAPVNSLMSFIDILDNGNISPEKLALYAKDLKQNLGHTSALMNNLLNWAASQMQGFKPVKENVDLRVLVDDITNTLQHHLQQKQVTVKNNIALDTIINADRNMTAAVLRNLVSNAIKYSYPQGTVLVSFENVPAGYHIIVKDEGTGMDPLQVAQFNNSIEQTATSKRGTANEKGTGLGLLLCKTFTTQMGGKIYAEKNATGMSFIVALPGKAVLSA